MTHVFMVELAGAVAALYTPAPTVRDRYVTMLIDAEAVEAALIRGYSSQEDTADLVSVFWQITVDYNVGMYVSRTPTDTNPSDGPSRCVFTEVESRGASWLDTDPKNRALDPSRWQHLSSP